jgi:Zn-dependent protease with chaperone function
MPFSPPQNPLLLPAAPSTNVIFFQAPSVFSITGLLCLGGAIAAAGYFTVAILFGKEIVMKNLHVVIMSADEYGPLQEKVKEISCKIGVSEPKIGLNDDLMPNAFTVGFGRKAVIVFSLGILNMLDIEELAAVVSHELAHVKAKDYLFRSLSYALNVFSFFNPLCYFAVSEVQKQRELFADERGTALLGQPKLMASVLAKLEEIVKVFPNASFADKLSASSFFLSPLARRTELLAGHPQIGHRLRNINAVLSRPAKKPRNIVATSLLLVILVAAAALSGYSVLQVQKAFFQNNNVFFFNKSVSNQSSIFNVTSENSGNFGINSQILTNSFGSQTSQESQELPVR